MSVCSGLHFYNKVMIYAKIAFTAEKMKDKLIKVTIVIISSAQDICTHHLSEVTLSKTSVVP